LGREKNDEKSGLQFFGEHAALASKTAFQRRLKPLRNSHVIRPVFLLSKPVRHTFNKKTTDREISDLAC
jgi:hypothetical protein